MNDTLSVVEAAARLGKGRTWAYEWAKGKHQVEGVRILRIGRDYRISRYEMDRLLGVRDEVSA